MAITDVRLSINDVSCILDVSGQVQNVLDTFLPQVAQRQLANTAIIQRPRSTFDSSPRLGLPVVNWPPAPPPRINQLYWPQGATRWATFYALMYVNVDDWNNSQPWQQNPEKYLELDATVPVTLKIETFKPSDTSGFDIESTMEMSMYVLEPIIIKEELRYSDDDIGSMLWLVPLVDQRYFWQTASVDLEDGQGSWSALRGKIETALDITIDVEGTEVGYPDPFEFAGVQSAAHAIDAMCWSAGMRFVATHYGDYFMQDRAKAREEIDGRDLWETLKAAGSTIFTNNPNPKQGYRVTFRKLVDDWLMPPHDVYQVTDGGTFKDVLEVSAFATYTNSEYASDADSPNNASGLDTLADDIFKGVCWHYGAEDAYFMDYAHYGINPEERECGWDDCWIVNVGTLENERLVGSGQQVRSKFDYHVTTRVKSLSSGVTVRHVCTSLDGLNYGRLNQYDVVIATCDSAVTTSDATFDCTVTSSEIGYVAASTSITVNNLPDTSNYVFYGDSGTKIRAYRYGGENAEWYWMIAGCNTSA